MLIKQQKLWLAQGGHQQGQRLPLPARKQAHLGGQPVLQAQIKHEQRLAVLLPLLAGNAPGEPAGAAAAPGQGQVLLNVHIGAGAPHGVLKHPAQVFGALVLGQARYIRPVDDDAAVVGRVYACHAVEQRGFAGAVAADHGNKVAFLKRQVHALQRHALVDRAPVEHFIQVGDRQHLTALPAAYAALMLPSF
ncbi:hypothetical protein SDC9_92458 [bioreactor metagenome]|uniref:Uncharacterized protein n=1 Tax=bioreactor metagenome TaxID=1076179 RepID=A0A644ZYH7_9ZZZZ